MALPKNRNEFTRFIVRQITGGVLRLNLSTESIDDAVDAGILYVQSYTKAAQAHEYWSKQISQADLDRGYMDAHPRTIMLVKALGLNGEGRTSAGVGSQLQVLPDGLNLPGMGFMPNGGTGYGGGGMSGAGGWTQMIVPNGNSTGAGIGQYYQTLSLMAEYQAASPMRSRPIDYTPATNTFQIRADKGSFSVGNWVCIEGYFAVDEERHVRFWRDPILQECVALKLKMAQGNVLRKYTGAKLAGDVDPSVGGQKMYDEASADWEKFDNSVRRKGRSGRMPNWVIG